MILILMFLHPLEGLKNTVIHTLFGVEGESRRQHINIHHQLLNKIQELLSVYPTKKTLWHKMKNYVSLLES